MKEITLYQEITSAISKVINQGGYINIVVDEVLSRNNFKDSQKRLFTKMVYGTVENKILIDYYLKEYTRQKRLKPPLKNALRMAVYGIVFLNLANHFMVDMAVEVVKKHDYKGSKLVNGVLRNFIQNPLPDLTLLPKREYLSVKYSFPLFLVDLLISQYQEEAENILDTLSKESKNALRINTLKGSIEEVETRLKNDNIDFEREGMVLYTSQSMINHALFQEGLVTYQDASSQLVSEVVDPRPGDYILDACSAPGGKTAHMAALGNNQVKIVAVDIHDHKLRLMEENFARLGVQNVELVLEDALNLGNIYPEGTFDKVLIDAPCSGLGVSGHKVDLKYLLDEEKIDRLISLQKELLIKVSPLVKNGGALIYSTCTINKQENEDQIINFLNNNPKWKKIEEKLILPSSDCDGFYICKLIKEESNDESKNRLN